MNSKRGFYIMFEGGEGCGKDTQANLLEKYLLEKGYEVINTKEPGGTFEANQIRQILLGKENKLDDLTELFLYQAARRDLNQKLIIPAINSGKHVISRRGFPSTHAYQGFGGGIDLSLIQNLNALSMQKIMPDLIYIIDIDPVEGLKKEVNPDRFALKGLEYHQKVRQGYLDITKKHSDISVIISYQKGEKGKQNMQKGIRYILKQRFNL